MTWKAIVAGGALALLATAIARADSNDPDRPGVTVRLFDQVGAPNGLPAAMTEATAILGAIGVSVSWLECSGLREPASCQRPLGHREVVVRLALQARRATVGRDVMGDALIDPTSRHSRLATVYVQAVARLAQRARIDADRLLGAVIAHEIVHLLLNDCRHTRSGLMRARWSPTELARDELAHWHIAHKEALAIRAVLTERVTPGE